MFFLKQSTAGQKLRVLLVDATDGKTPETGVTSPTVKLAKNNGAFGDPGDGTWAEQAYGWYTAQLNAADTGTLGPLQLHVEKAGCRNFDDHGMVLAANAYDALFGSDKLDVNVAEVSGDATAADHLEADYDGTGYAKANSAIGTCTANADMRGTDGANTTTPPAAAAIRTELEGEGHTLHTVAADVAGLDGDAMRGTDGANTVTPPSASAIRSELEGSGAVLDKLDDTVEDDGGTWRFTANALEQAPGGSGSGEADWSAAERAQLRKALGITGDHDATTGAGNLDVALARLAVLVGLPAVASTAITEADQDIAHYRGDTAPITFDLGRDITGASLAFTVKRRVTDPQGAALITKTSAQSSEIEITNPAAGQFRVKLLAGDTADLLPDGRRAVFAYDVQMTLSGAIETVAAGDFVLIPDVTTG